MLKDTKRQSVIKKALMDLPKVHNIKDAVDLLKQISQVKFVESVDIAVNLGIDPKKSEQNVRGSVVLPHGTGKNVRIAVFTGGTNVDAALKAGADFAGLEDLAEKVKANQINVDIVLATPDAMRVVGQLGQILGPRGLMPNPKDGTVTADIVTAVNNAKKGQVRYRADKAGIIHCTVGKMNFEFDALNENIATILAALKKAKPSSSKGVYFKKVTLSSTMGPGLLIDVSGMIA